MYNSNIPTDRALPSTARLIKSTVIAAVTASVLLATVVLPAEYGIDPTGIGKTLGLQRMGEIKNALALEVAADSAEDLVKQTEKSIEMTSTITAGAINKDTTTIILAPNEGKEVKVNMRKDAVVTYQWSSNDGIVKFDVHGDAQALKISYHNYEKGAAKTKEGSITAAFDGSHGWFWRNRTNTDITITLKAKGQFTNMQHMQ